MAIYCSFGEGAHGLKPSWILLNLREPALWLSLLSLLVILRKTPVVGTTAPQSNEMCEAPDSAKGGNAPNSQEATESSEATITL
jgi:hypothetical protein